MSELTQIRRQLEQRRQQLEARVARIESDLRQPGHRDSEEQATESEPNEVRERLVEAERVEIEDIRRAVERIDAGSYGECARCGEAIAAGRLDALPYATLCVDCAA